MGQERYYNFGGTAGYSQENIIHGTLNEKGVYLGFELTVDSAGNLEVAIGSGLLQDGIVWRETDTQTILFSSPGTATNYTLIATHEDRAIIGGVPVEYSLEEGIFSDSEIDNGVVLGWVYHPGGGVPLEQSHLLNAPRRTAADYTRDYINSAPIELIPKLTRTSTTNAGPNITVTESDFDGSNFVVYQRVENSPTAVPAVQQVIQNITLYYNTYRPLYIDVYTRFAASPSTKLTIEVYDVAQAPVTVTNGVVTGTGSWDTHTATIDRSGGTFDVVGKPYTIRLTYDVNKGEYIDLGRILISRWPYPTL